MTPPHRTVYTAPHRTVSSTKLQNTPEKQNSQSHVCLKNRTVSGTNLQNISVVV